MSYYYRECLDTCEFDLPIWDCTRLRCGTYSPPPHSQIVSPSLWDDADPLYCGTTELVVECNVVDGIQYVREGSPPGTCETSFTVTCNNDRDIVNQNEKCVRPFCAPVADPIFVTLGITANAASFSPDNGMNRVPPGSSVTMTCAEGYRAVNLDQATCMDPPSFDAICTDDCVYDSSDYFCVPIVCSLNNAANIIYDRENRSPFLPFQASLQAACMEGYRIGSHDPNSPKVNEIFCGSDCGFTPECQPVTCGSFTPPSFSSLLGTAEAQEVFYGTAAVQCDEGYVVEGTTAPMCESSFQISCNDNGTITWEGSGRCMPRICDCPGAGDCVTTRISCGSYNVPLFSNVLADSGWTQTRDYEFGELIQLQCQEGHRVRSQFPGKPAGASTCSKAFSDECLSIGLFRSAFEEPCEPVMCPSPNMEGLVKDPVMESVEYGTVVSQSCAHGYEPSDQLGLYVTTLPLESNCRDDCTMSAPLTCTFSQCGMYAAFDYSIGVERVEPVTQYRGQLEIVCKPNYMLDDRVPCTTAEQTEADNCIPIKGMEAAFSSAIVLGTTAFPAPSNVRLPETWAVSGSYGSVTVKVPGGAWPAEAATEGLTITAIDIPPAQHPAERLKALVGPAINFGPDGLGFLLPVMLALPFDCPGTGSCEELYAGKSIVPHKYVNGEWVAIEYATADLLDSSIAVVDYVNGIVRGQTQSFSTYAAVSVVVVTETGVGDGADTGTGDSDSDDGNVGGVVVVEEVATTSPQTTTAAVFALIGSTPPPVRVERSQVGCLCMND